jgi:hypothetical protein
VRHFGFPDEMAQIHWQTNAATAQCLAAGIQPPQAHTAGPASSTASSSRSWAEVSLHGPPAASARRHRFADIRVTQNCRATSRSLVPDLDQVSCR